MATQTQTITSPTGTSLHLKLQPVAGNRFTSPAAEPRDIFPVKRTLPQEPEFGSFSSTVAEPRDKRTLPKEPESPKEPEPTKLTAQNCVTAVDDWYDFRLWFCGDREK
eukprot:TRINITY_DN4088_c0_g1_i1.p2 TRINITY_DN4088_c0_g1~~TRINITY_DN4088_c0_g1_i1.p2  ORF type:complete len:108 (+),score=19.73 TRINITY_DN4088_c0_g1_i1:85-408(+)